MTDPNNSSLSSIIHGGNGSIDFRNVAVVRQQEYGVNYTDNLFSVQRHHRRFFL